MTEPIWRNKVMIVDDSEIVLAVAQHALKSAGYHVVTHPRPAGCIALILQEVPDLLLIDVNMPGLNGDTLVKMLGSTQSSIEMVVLLHSSLAEDVLAQKATASRAHGYIRKTENPQDLVRQVARWMRPGARSGTYRFGTGILDMSRHANEPRPQVSAQGMSADSPASRILLADHEMVELAELRRLLISQRGQVEFALSGKEVLRRLQGDNPPDIVVLGRLVELPDSDEVLREAARLNPQWESRFIVVHDSAVAARLHGRSITRLRRPITAVALRGAIQSCLQRAS